MSEHVAPFVYYLEVHLLYASLLCLAAWAVTSVPGASATCKYWIWVATSLNFLVPLGGFFDHFGASTYSWGRQLAGLDLVGLSLSHHVAAGGLIAGVWLCGATVMFVRLLGRLRECVGDTYQAPPGGLRRCAAAPGVAVRFSGTARGPSVEGFMRPSISLPDGIGGLLSPPELDAILIHEVTHARRRDNLIGLIQELVLCGLWFHPLAWLTGSRLALYRELSCDDAVIAKAHGSHLVAALAKLAVPEERSLLQAGAASFMGHRLARLTSSQPEAPYVFNAMLAALFGALLLACILGSVVHTAHCFVIRT
jgi:beta-lactamase regulating signal transducer with metallopeptidase domain